MMFGQVGPVTIDTLQNRCLRQANKILFFLFLLVMQILKCFFFNLWKDFGVWIKHQYSYPA